MRVEASSCRTFAKSRRMSDPRRRPSLSFGERRFVDAVSARTHLWHGMLDALPHSDHGCSTRSVDLRPLEIPIHCSAGCSAASALWTRAASLALGGSCWPCVLALPRVSRSRSPMVLPWQSPPLADPTSRGNLRPFAVSTDALGHLPLQLLQFL